MWTRTKLTTGAMYTWTGGSSKGNYTVVSHHDDETQALLWVDQQIGMNFDNTEDAKHYAELYMLLGRT